MYVDESGDTGYKNTPTQYFILSAIVINELDWNFLIKDLTKFRKRLRDSKGLMLREEIHCTDFINKPGDLKRIKRNDRLDIMKKCVDWIASQKNRLSVITVCIDKSKRNFDVFEYAWRILIQRFENTLYHSNFPSKSRTKELGLLLPDNTDGDKLTNLMKQMRKYNRIPNNRGNSIGEYNNYPIQYIIEEPFLKLSHNNFLTQMADVIAYCARQLYEPNAYMKKKGGHNFYKRLLPVINFNVSLEKNNFGIVEI